MANETTRKLEAEAAEEARQDLLDRIEELEGKLAGARSEADAARQAGNLAGCIWCGEVLGKRDDLGLAAKIRVHIQACKKNPLVHENRMLREELQAKGWHHDRVANADQVAGELEARRSRLANEVVDLRARQRELLVALASTASISAILQTRLEESEKHRGAAEASLAALEHKVWTALGGPAEPGEDLVTRLMEELDCSSRVDQVRDQAVDVAAITDRLRFLVAFTWGEAEARGSTDELLAALERNVAEDHARAVAFAALKPKVPDQNPARGFGQDVSALVPEADRLPAVRAMLPKFSLGTAVTRTVEASKEVPAGAPAGIGIVREAMPREPNNPSSGFIYRTDGWADGHTYWVPEDKLTEWVVPF